MPRTPFKRPGDLHPGVGCSTDTPTTADMAALLGRTTFEGVAFTRDQFERLLKFYGFTRVDAEVEASRQSHANAVKKFEEEYAKADEWKRRNMQRPKDFDPRGIAAFFTAGRDTGCFREARTDGLRVMAFISKYLQPGEDPVKLVIQMASEAGFDVDPEAYGWATEDDDYEGGVDDFDIPEGEL